MKKYRLGMIMAVFAFIAMLPLRATAAETKEVGVTCAPAEEGNNTEYSVDLYIPNAAKEEISVLGLKLDVTPETSAGGYEGAVEFSEDVKARAKICEYRYNNTLNIYIAGTSALFNEDDTLHIGKVSMKNASGELLNLTKVKLDNAEDALMVVRGWDSEAVNMENWIDNPDVDEPAGPDIPEDPDNSDKEAGTEFAGTGSDEFTVSEKSEPVIKKSALAYIQEHYAEQLAALDGDYKVVSRLNLSGLTDSDVQQTVKDAFIARLASGWKIGQYYEINITADVQRKDGTPVEGLSDIQIPQLSGTISISLTIPKDLRKSGRAYQMFHYMNDESVDILKSSVKDNKIIFQTDSFSPYALVYGDDVKGGGSGSGTGTDSNGRPRSAKTGDGADLMLYLILGMVSFAGGAAVLSMKKRRACR